MEVAGEYIHGRGHVERACQAQLQLREAALNLRDEMVEALHLLYQEDGVRCGHVRRLGADVLGGAGEGQLHLELGQGGLHLGLASRSRSAARGARRGALGRQLADTLAHVIRLCNQQAQIRVGVQSEEQRRVRRTVVHVRPSVRKGAVSKGAEARGKEEVRLLLQELAVQEVVEVGCRAAPVPRVRNMASVHDISNNVAQVRPRDHVTRLHVVLHHTRAHREVASREGVWPREAEATKAPAPEHQGVEESEGKHDGLEHLRLGGALKEALADGAQRRLHVGLDVSGRLVGNLDGGLQNGLGDGLHVRESRRLRGEEAPEVAVPRLRNLLEHLLQAREPRLHEVHVL
mmetsp:Transcript_24582/g.66848  ORF Transcript_24582/g.66848 Transcript_24582/m.66848 type:complete len:346 (+) Transcript_24582:962-1999(+)